MMIIALTGAAFCGKDTVGGYLSDLHEFKTMAFADPIREGLRTMLGLSPLDFSPENKETVIDWIGKSPRQLMQTLGTEWGRQQVAGDIWCRSMAQRIQVARRMGYDAVVITDCRFPEEAELVHRLGGHVWRIERPGAFTTTHHTHASETAGQHIIADRTLINDGTIEQLFEKVDELLDEIIDNAGIDVLPLPWQPEAV